MPEEVLVRVDLEKKVRINLNSEFFKKIYGVRTVFFFKKKLFVVMLLLLNMEEFLKLWFDNMFR